MTPDNQGPNHTAGQAFVPVSTTTCGSAQSVFLPVGQYQVALAGARGSSNNRQNGNNPGGAGAAITATFDVTSNITVGYYIGCAARSVSSVGGGGGGSYIYLIGTNQPAILVAGGGGGGGFYGTNPGRPGGITFDGVATQADGTPGATSGSGGGRFPGDTSQDSGAGGGGFMTAGLSLASSSGSFTGGRQSTNYGGDFAGGFTFAIASGGAGSGGGAGNYGGGGGGGHSGGGSGRGTNTAFNNGGGGGGASYANPGSPGGVSVTPLTIAATSTGMGSLVITKVGV